MYLMLTSMQVGVDYVGRNLHAKLTSTAERAPLITASAVAGAGKIAFAGEAVFNARATNTDKIARNLSSYGQVTRWSAAATWMEARQAASLNLTTNMATQAFTTTLAYSYALDSATSMGEAM